MEWVGEEILGRGVSEGVSLRIEVVEIECKLPFPPSLLTGVELRQGRGFKTSGDDSRRDDGLLS